MTRHAYPAELVIEPVTHALNATVSVPGSKSITNRALVLAALMSQHQPCTLDGALQSEDTEVMLQALTQLGFSLEVDWPRIRLNKHSSQRNLPNSIADLFVANSGTSMRFLTAMVASGAGKFRLDGIARMRERPIQDLLDALNQFEGVHARSESGSGCPPVIIESTGMRGGHVRVRADVSSQFLSGLLLAAPFASHPVTIEIDGEVVSEPYIEMTVTMLCQWGCEVKRSSGNQFQIQPCSRAGGPTQYTIEPDASAASYFFAAAAIAGGRMTVREMTLQMMQGDVHFVRCLEQMGCRVESCDSGITIHGKPLQGIDVDMNAISDTVMTLAAVACFANGPTTIRNVGHIRHKETDRIAALAIELRKLGAEVIETEDGLRITPRPLKGCAVDTYNDHRMAMSLALIGLRIPNVVIRNPACVAKTYPGYWQDLESIRAPAHAQ